MQLGTHLALGEGYAPAFLAYGQDLITPTEALMKDITYMNPDERISERMHDMKKALALLSGRREKRGERNKRNYDAIREHAEFKLGDAVYTLIQRTPPGMPRKLFDKWRDHGKSWCSPIS